LGQVVQNPPVSETSEVGMVQQGTVSSETHETAQPVESSGENVAETPSGVLDSFGQKEAVSKTSEAETLSSTAVPENESEVLDTFPGVYGEMPESAPATEDYREWEADGWG